MLKRSVKLIVKFIFILLVTGNLNFVAGSMMRDRWREVELGGGCNAIRNISKLVNEWKYNTPLTVVRESLENTTISQEDLNDLLLVGNVACARVFLISKFFVKPEVRNVQRIFLSGVYTPPRIMENKKLSPFVRNIASYDFAASSDQTFAHSERGFMLSVLKEEGIYTKEGDYTVGLVIQIHNISNPMCGECKNFLLGESPYFIDLDGWRHFVGINYVKLRKKALSEDRNWKEFLDVTVSVGTKLGNYYTAFLEEQGEKDSHRFRRKFHDKVVPQSVFDINIINGGTFVVGTCASEKYIETLTFAFDSKK